WSVRRHHRHLPSFPTRRSSDLVPIGRCICVLGASTNHLRHHGGRVDRRLVEEERPGIEITPTFSAIAKPLVATTHEGHVPGAVRSEEHTSELQSRETLVCRPLL